jgi:hypothetical protein
VAGQTGYCGGLLEGWAGGTVAKDVGRGDRSLAAPEAVGRSAVGSKAGHAWCGRGIGGGDVDKTDPPAKKLFEAVRGRDRRRWRGSGGGQASVLPLDGVGTVKIHKNILGSAASPKFGSTSLNIHYGHTARQKNVRMPEVSKSAGAAVEGGLPKAHIRRNKEAQNLNLQYPKRRPERSFQSIQRFRM